MVLWALGFLLLLWSNFVSLLLSTVKQNFDQWYVNALFLDIKLKLLKITMFDHMLKNSVATLIDFSNRLSFNYIFLNQCSSYIKEGLIHWNIEVNHCGPFKFPFPAITYIIKCTACSMAVSLLSLQIFIFKDLLWPLLPTTICIVDTKDLNDPKE